MIGRILTIVWLFLSALAHLHGGLPHYAADMLADPKNTHPILAAYRQWCTDGDARYCQRDACVMAFQLLTCLYAFPLCLVLIYAKISNRCWWEHPLQIVLCSGQCLGTLIYYLSAMFDDQGGKRPFSRIVGKNFYTHFLALNGLWVVIPVILITQSWMAIRAMYFANKKK